ncbi:hypothetical protein VRK_15350 [Vibrio sp. MEBiC08052]|nr:hypothetical protein VRK_15350 [Vibrio sp. MEBiC08052]
MATVIVCYGHCSLMKYFYFSLYIPYQEYLAHYSGSASHLVVKTDNGLTLQLPATHFRPYLTQFGLKGRFRLTTDAQYKFQRLELI